MSHIKLSFNLQHAQHEDKCWLLNIDGKDHFAYKVILYDVRGAVTRINNDSETKRSGWIDIIGRVEWNGDRATIFDSDPKSNGDQNDSNT